MGMTYSYVRIVDGAYCDVIGDVVAYCAYCDVGILHVGYDWFGLLLDCTRLNVGCCCDVDFLCTDSVLCRSFDYVYYVLGCLVVVIMCQVDRLNVNLLLS